MSELGKQLLQVAACQNGEFGDIRKAADDKLSEIRAYWHGRQQVTFNHLAVFEVSKEKEEEARLCYEKALAEYESIFGSDVDL